MKGTDILLKQIQCCNIGKSLNILYFYISINLARIECEDFVVPNDKIYEYSFYRDLFTEIEIMLTTSIIPPVCTLVIEETMPRGMYVDPDQLRDLQESTGFFTFVPTRVDIEKPEFESESFRVFIFRKLQIQENLRITSVKLPVHLRYHKPAINTDTKPSSSAPSAIIKLQNPRLLLSCEGENIAAHCPEKAVTSYCDSSGTEKCEYLYIPYEVVSFIKNWNTKTDKSSLYEHNTTNNHVPYIFFIRLMWKN